MSVAESARNYWAGVANDKAGEVAAANRKDERMRCIRTVESINIDGVDGEVRDRIIREIVAKLKAGLA